MDIAIVGIDCRFPGAPDPAQFWSLVVAGEIGLAREDDGTVAARRHPSPGYVPVAGALGEVDRFDAEFFGYTPREAAFLDPQQRIFLETCWHALEDSAIDPAGGARMGVFAGAGLSTYLLDNLAPIMAAGDETDAFLAYTANDKDFLATRVAFKLDLKGPAITVQTACSTALVAVHLACQSLMLGECDAALAGGITIRVPEKAGYVPIPEGIESQDGRCRPFDAQATGTVFANGAGAVVLKRLSDALDDGDRIYAVVKGTAINNDGADKSGFTAPSVAGQAAVITEALAVAGVSADSIAFVETHGAGTALGDAVELAALNRVFGACPPQTCALSATKANIGHTDVAAGIAGLIKATLALYHRKLPPLASWRAWGPALLHDIGPFHVPMQATPLVPRNGALHAAVSAFGVGGTNAHIVLQGPPPQAVAADDDRPQLLVLSAQDDAALSRQTVALGRAVAGAGRLADTAWTLQAGRAALAQRACVVVRDLAEAPRALGDARRVRTGRVADPVPRLAFLFPGQGAQFAGMGAALYRDEPVFAATIDAAAHRLRPALGFDLRTALSAGADDSSAAQRRLRETAVSQPAVLAIELALLALLRDWGLEPGIVLGHSLGEYAAMVAAGVLSFDDALDIVVERGRLMQALPGGAMVAVLAPAWTVRRHLAPGVEISAINGPEDCVMSGPAAAVAASATALDRLGIVTRPLETSHAFHSAMIEPMLDDFSGFLANRPRSAPRIALISNLTGGMLDGAPKDAYFAAHARQPVRFADGIATLLAGGPVIALEVGPGSALSSLARRQGLKSGHATLPVAGDRQALLDAVGTLWCAGLQPNWTRLHRSPRARLSLPTYPFAKTRHWLERETPGARARPAAGTLDVRMAGWRKHHPELCPLPTGRYAVIGAGETLSDRLSAAGTVVRRSLDEPIDCLIVTAPADRDLGPILAQALAGGRLRHCLFLLPGLFEVEGGDTPSADAAATAGLALALAREQPEIAVHIVDPGSADPATLLPWLFAAPKPFSAWRGRSCWIPDFQPYRLPTTVARSTGGAYLVVGASGRVGRIAAVAIAGLDPTGTIYLASRSGRAIEGIAGRPCAVDIQHPRPLIDEIIARHGRLEGVIFAAGSLSADSFASVTEPLPTAYSAVKREGLATLAAALETVPCEFVIVCGSISGWLGGVGYGAYAGANLAAATIARTAGHSQDTRWLTLSLDAIAGSVLPNQTLAEIQGSQLAQAFAGAIAAAASLGGAELIVSTSDFAVRYADFAESIGQGPATAGRTDDAPAGRQADPVAEAWRLVLGVEDARNDDSFFALGGSSLQALQLLARLRRGAGVELPLATFLQTPTLGALRARIATAPSLAEATPGFADAGPDEAPAPLSEGQLSLWLAEQRSETQGAFNIVELYRIEGPLNVDALRLAFTAIEARHEGLRTRFVEVAGHVVQSVDPPGRAMLSEQPIAAERLDACLSDEVCRRVDLAAEPAWRVRLLDAGPTGRFLMLSAHHLLLDDWSIGVMFEELAAAYDAGCDGRSPALPAPARRYADFCRAQAEAAGAGAYRNACDHWRRRLADAPRRLSLPPPGPDETDGAVRISLDAATVHAVRTIGQRCQTSPFTVLLAAYGTCLAAETGERDIVVGVPQAGRQGGDWERVVGYFVNPAALRVDLGLAADFLSLVAAVKATVADAAGHDQVPYERVAAALGAARHGLFNIWFTLLTHAAPRVMTGGLRLVPTRIGPRPSRFDLALVLEPDGDGLTGWLEYSGAAIGRPAVERLAARFRDVVAAVVARPETPMAALLEAHPGPGSLIDLPAARLGLAGRLQRRGSAAD